MTQFSGDRVDVLVVAAHSLEFEPLTLLLGRELRADLNGLWVAAVAVGVGMPAAGAGTLAALVAAAPSAVLLIGSYGLYPGRGHFAPGRLLVPSRILAVDSTVLAGSAAFPRAMPCELEPDATLSSALIAASADIDHAPLATTLAITTDDELAARITRGSGCWAENLEALAVGLACQARGVPFSAVLACTNQVGSKGRAQWAEHRQRAADACSALSASWLLAGAPGLPASAGRTPS